MPYDLGVIKRQRREPPVISTSTYGGNFVGFYSTGTSYYAVHIFTSSGQFTKPSYVTTTTAQVLVVAGGGGGGPATASGVGGGGGAGGIINSSTYSITGTLTILIGAGGATNAIGSASTLTSSVTVLTASGGGGGGAPLNGSGYEGGSGGGGSGTGTGGASTSTQGNVGGSGGSQTSYAGGGGGASAAGGAANASAAGQGGSGTITLITGSPIWVAGGGGGGANAAGYNNGSYGGGSAGGTTSAVAGTAGITNSGGGGGGGGGTTGAGGNGGSGIVIISYAIPANLYPLSQSDPYFSNNALLLNVASPSPLSDSSNIVGNIISDFSVNATPISNFGGTASSTLNPFDPSSYHSLYFNGNAYLTSPVGSLPATTTNFTIEFWMYAVSSDNITNHWLVGSAESNGFYVFHHSNYISIGQLGVITYTSPTAFSLNQWVHVAVVRSSNIFYIYQNGNVVFTQSWNPTFLSGVASVGGLPGQGAFHTGYLSNIRATLSAVYTGNFIVLSQQLSTIQNALSTNISAISSGVTLLTGRFSTTSTNIVDYSTLTNTISVTGVTASSLNPFTDITTYNSIQFNGNNYLSATRTGGWLLSSADYTVEAWVYLNTSTTSNLIIAGTAGKWQFWQMLINNYYLVVNHQLYTDRFLRQYAVNSPLEQLLSGNETLSLSNQCLGVVVNGSNPFTDYLGSLNFVDGGGDYPQIFFSDQINLGSNDFTIEAWVYTDPYYSGWVMGDGRANGYNFYGWGIYTSSRGLQFYYGSGFLWSYFLSTSNITSNQWSHIAFVRSGNTWTWYINGTASGTGSISFPIYYNGQLNLAAGVQITRGSSIGFNSYYGYMSNIRIVNGLAVYTGNFNVPTSPFTSRTQSANPYGGSNTQAISTASYTALLFAVSTTTKTQQLLAPNTWNHVAWSRSGSTNLIYINGVRYVSTSAPTYNPQLPIVSDSTTMYIGGGFSANYPYFNVDITSFIGNISNFRIVNGTVVYPGNFTVPNGPLQLTQVANAYGGSNTQAISTTSYVGLLTAKYYAYAQGSTGFVDYGTNNLGITPKGNPGQGTFSPFGNNWSTLFNGTTDHLSIPVIYSSSATLSKFNLGFNDFTIETWAYLTANTGTAYIAGQLNASNYAPMGLYISSNKPTLGISNVGSSWNLTVTNPTAISTGTWNHIAAVRNGTRFSMYLNGVEQSFGVSAIPSADISINTATVVTTNVTNSTLNPYDQGPYHSLYFNGVSHLSLPANAGYNFGTGDFTIELWLYPITYIFGSSTASETIDFFDTTSGSYRAGQFQIQINSAGTVTFYYATAAAADTALTSTAIITLNAWSHVAVVRSGSAIGNLKIYLNGNVVATSGAAVTQTLGSTGPGSIGKQTNGITGGNYFNGYISNLRIVKGLALYTSAFLSPQSPFSTIQSATPSGALANLTTNTTQLLIGKFVNQQYFFDDYSSNNFTLTNNGGVAAANLSPPISSTSTFNSMYFNGSNYLITPTNTAFQFGTGNFTIECWWYQSVSNADRGFVSSIAAYSAQGVQLCGNGAFTGLNSAGSYDTFSWTLPLNQWNHVAFVRINGTAYAYVNGVLASSGPTTRGNNLTGSALVIGTSYTNNFTFSAVGYISNLRIVKGTALYIGNFTLPVSQLTNVSGTSLLIAKSSAIIGEGLSQLTADFSIAPISVTTGTANNSLFSPSNLYPPISSTSTLYNSVNIPGNLTNAKIDYTNTAFATGTGDFTVECWVWMNSLTGGTGGILASCSATVPGFIIARDQFGVYNANGSGGQGFTWTFPTNAWAHVALCIQSGWLGGWLNGVAAGSPIIRTAGSLGSTTISLGRRYTSDTISLIGYISNLRFVAGLAVYNTGTSFTRPTGPLTATQSANPFGGSNTQAITASTSTKLLTLLSTSATNIVDYSTNTSVITMSTGSVSLSTLDPFGIYTSANFHSLYFGGNGSISATSSTGWLVHGDHTVEAWVYLNTSTIADSFISDNNNMLIAGTYDGVGTTGWEWTINPYIMAINYRNSGVVTSFGTSQISNLNQLLTDNGGLGLSPANTAVTFIATNPLSRGYGSLNFNGTNAQIKQAASQGFNFGSGSFTIEAWVYYLGTAATTTIIGNQNGPSPGRSWLFSMLVGGALYFDWSSTGTSGVPGSFASTSAAPLNQWNHVAFVRNGTVYTFYINGQAAGSGSMTASVAYSGSLAVGYTPNETTSGQSFFKGYLSNIRVVKGLAVYTGNFTPTGPLTASQTAGTNIQAILTASYTSILLAASPVYSQTFAINTWNHVAFTRLATTASMYINGVRTTSTQITGYTEQNTLRLGYIGFSTATSAYLTGYISNFRIVSGVAVYTGTNFVPPTGILTAQQPPNPYSGTNTNAITFNTSTRIATALFNGLNISPYNTNTNMLIGRAGSAVTSVFPGYLSNLRIVNGTAVYTSNFIPPSAPLPIVTNTSLLIAATSRHVDISGNNFIVTTGTVTSLPAITKFTPYKIPGEYNKSVVGGSVYFNTTTAASQNLSLGTLPSLALGSGNYTVELWVYPISYNTVNSSLIDWRTNAGTTAGVPVLYLLSTGFIQWQNTGGTGLLTSPDRVPLNTWNHVSMIRNNSMLYMYINGAVTTSTADATALSIQTLFINSPITASNQTLFGYVSNVRIVVGTAVYRPTFTIPTKALTSVTNTVLLTLQNNAPEFKDNSVNNFVLNKPSTSTVFQQALSPFGGVGSAYFNGINNYLIVSTGTSTAFAFGSGDFTIEAWVYPVARNIYFGSVIIGSINYPSSTLDWALMITPVGYLNIRYGLIGLQSSIVSSSVVPLSVWSHVAFTRTFGLISLYINGKVVGNNVAGSVVSTAAGKLVFNGSTQYLYVPGTNPQFAFGTGDFTVEMWVYQTARSANAAVLYDSRPAGTGSGASHFGISIGPAGEFFAAGAGTISLNTWYHIAFVRNGTTTKAYINGVAMYNGTDTTNWLNGTNRPIIGTDGNVPLSAGYIFNGYITNLRVVKGTAVYTSNFTPVVPLSNITNTSMLLLVASDANKIVDSSSSPVTITNVGGVTYSNAELPSVNLSGGGLTTATSTINVSIGAASTGSTATTFNGYINNIHVIKGLAKYSSGFTPVENEITTVTNSSFLTLSSTDTTFIDRSLNAFTITNSTTATTFQGFAPFGKNYSTYFNNNYLNIADKSSLDLSNSLGWTIETWVKPAGYYGTNTNSILFAKRNPSSGAPTYNSIYFSNGYVGVSSTYPPFLPYLSGDFTIECWVNFPAVDNQPNGIFHFATSDFGNSAGSPYLAVASGGYSPWIVYYGLGLSTNLYGSYGDPSTFLPYPNIWYHVALVRFANVLKLFINGIGYPVSFNDTTDYSLITNLIIGAYDSPTSPTSPAAGYISNFRIVSDVAVYTDDNFNLPYPGLETTQIDNPDGGINTQAISTSSYTKLLLGQFIGASDSIVDYSDYDHSVTSFGTLAASTILVGYGGSLSFDGVSKYLTVSSGVSTFGTGAWTVECWINIPQSFASALVIIDTRSGATPFNGVQLAVQTDSSLSWHEGASTLVIQTASAVVTTGKWYHIAMVRSGTGTGQCKIYVNGVSKGSGTSTLNHLGYTTYISRNATAASNYFAGYISNLRIVTGSAVYTGNFTSPIAQLNRTQTANISGSPSVSIPTPPTASFKFDGGSTQYLSIPNDASLNMGSSDFTVEAWIYRATPIIPARSILSKRATTATYAGINLTFATNSLFPQALATLNGTSWGINLTSYIPVSTATWTHIAFTRNNDNWILWQNGTAVASQNFYGVIPTNTAPLTIGSGAPVTAAQIFQGAISNLRIVKNIAIYTGNFTPPTTQLTSTQTASTNILAIPDDVVVNSSLDMTSGIAFSFPATPNYDLSYKSFTMEFWIYPTSLTGGGGVSSYAGIWNFGIRGTFGAPIAFISELYAESDGSFTFISNQGGFGMPRGEYRTSGGLINLNTWTHIAAVRDYTIGTFKLFVNGTEQFTTTSFVEPIGSFGRAMIGKDFTTFNHFIGYLTDFRLVNGVAVYTGTFTPPTTPLKTTQAAGTNITGFNDESKTVLLIGRRFQDSSIYRNILSTVDRGSGVISSLGPFTTNNTGTVLLTAQSYSIVDNSMNCFTITNAGGIIPWTINPLGNTSTTLLINNINTQTGFTDKSLNNFAFGNFGLTNTATTYPFGIKLEPSTSYQGYLSSSTGWIGFYDGTTYSTTTVVLSSSTWNHVAYTYEYPTSSVNIYVNGYRILNTSSVITDSNEALYIGGILGSTEYFNGYMSNFRLIKGSSLYLGPYIGDLPRSLFTTSTNTVPYPTTSTISTSLLTLQNGYLKENSINGYSIIIGGTGTLRTSAFSPVYPNSNLSMYFNGTTDFLNVSAQNALSFGTGDFTIEVWVYPTAVPGNYAPVIEARASAAATPWVVGMRTSGGVLTADFYDGVARTAPTTIQLGIWTHLAWTRTNSTLRVFVNGQIDLTSANNITNMNAQVTTQFIGKLWDGANNFFQGFMSDLRVVKGTSLYTGNFNPSKLPLTTVVGTTTNLLTTFVNTRAVEYSGNTVVKANTSTLTVGAITKNNVYSISFNGTSDFLSVSSSTGFSYNANDFTWEMWVYPTSPNWASTTTVLLDHAGSAGGLFVSNNRLSYYNASVATSTASFILIVNSSTWTHIAAARSNNVTSLFVNGALATSISDSNNFNISRSLTIGNTSTVANNYFQGYIEDVRITKGLARYTASFVPPIKLSNR